MICDYCKQPIQSSHVTYGLIKVKSFPFCEMHDDNSKHYHKGDCSREAARVWDIQHKNNWCWR